MPDKTPEDKAVDGLDAAKTLHAAVSCYLTTLQAVADAVGDSCPPIGGPYRHRLSRLRARLAFDTNPESIEESCVIASRELRDFAEKAFGYIESHRGELRRAVAGLDEIVRSLAQRQEFYGERLQQFAAKMETTPYPAERERLADVIASKVACLLSCVESMRHETQSQLKRMRNEIAQVEARIAESEITDRVTGLMNRREMDRRIAEVKAKGQSPVLLLFDFQESLPDEVAQQVSSRLSSQFRHCDLIASWSVGQFLVMFQGRAETALARAEQVVPWIAGRYLLDTGATLETAVEARLLDEAWMPETELAAAR